MKVVNVQKAINQLEQLYVYKKVGDLNDQVIHVVQVENRTLDFHVHEQSDELFYVVEGSFWLETAEEVFTVDSGEFIIVPKGVKHRPVVTGLTKFVLVELAGTLTKENSGGSMGE